MNFGVFICSKIMDFDVKWVHMARYKLILKQEGAIWLRIIRPENPSRIHKYIENPEIHRESRNPSSIQESIENPEIHREYKKSCHSMTRSDYDTP